MGRIDFITAIFISFPEGIVLTALTLQLLNTNINKQKLLLVGFMYAITSLIIRSFDIPYGIHTIILIIALSIYCTFLHKIKFGVTVIGYLFCSIIEGISEVVAIPIVELVSHKSLETAMNSEILKILFAAPTQILMGIIFLVMYKFNICFLSRETMDIIKYNSKISKTLLYTISLLLFQNFVIILLYLSYKVSSFNHIFLHTFINIFPLVILTLILISIILITVIKRNINNLYKENEYELQNIMLENVNEVIKVLRSERHDYMNDFQILYGLNMAEEYEQAKDYLKEVCADISNSSDYINIGCPAVSGLIMVKSEIARVKNISFDKSLDADLSRLKLRTHDLCKLYGNLIQNAIEGTEGCEIRKVQINLYEDEAGYIIFEISNTIPVQVEIRYEDMFNFGVSSKDENRGTGLYIVKQIIDKNKGHVDINCQDGMIKFIIALPI